MTNLEIYEIGLGALCEKLGPAGPNRFRQYCAQGNVEKAASRRSGTAAASERHPP